MRRLLLATALCLASWTFSASLKAYGGQSFSLNQRLELIFCTALAIVLAYHYAKWDWLSTQRKFELHEARKRYEFMQKRINHLCETGDSHDRDEAMRLNECLSKYLDEVEYLEQEELVRHD